MSDLKTELLRIREERGKLTPAIVLAEATDPEHPLHDKFEWDDSVAAEKYRLAQAAQLLRVTFRQTAESGEVANLRHFWVIKGTEKDSESQYVPIEEVIVDPISRNIMLRQMFREWKRFKARYAHYEEFSRMVLDDPDMVDPDEEFGEKNGSED